MLVARTSGPRPAFADETSALLTQRPQGRLEAGSVLVGLRVLQQGLQRELVRAGASTSGITPVPSQFVLVIGLMALPTGMKAEKWSVRRTLPPGFAPPHVGAKGQVTRDKWQGIVRGS